MGDTWVFGLILLAVGLAATAAVLSNRLGAAVRVPAPALFLVGAALASDLVPALNSLSITTVERVVTVALATILLDGGIHIGRRRFMAVAGPVVWLGVAGTLVTAVSLAALAHLLFGFGWLPSLLLGTALAPTDPAVVFSVLGQREVTGRAGTLLEGESGANDPVGIALMAALLAAQGSGAAALGAGLLVFALQMLVGAAVGVAGGWMLLTVMRRLPLPSEGLYPLRVLALALVVYGLAAAAHGSGFLAVFVAGIVIGDQSAPYKREITRFIGALSSLAEIVAFVVLGLTVRLATLPDGGAWLIGLVLAVALAFVVRPVLVGLVLLPVRLTRGERVFVLWSGLKGAVPILLGTFILGAHGVGDTLRLYDVIFVVVLFSVVVQGGLVPWVAARCGVPMRQVRLEPWALGVRLRDEPAGVRQYLVVAGSAADGTAVAELAPDQGLWIAMAVRDGMLLQVHGDLVLRAGDEVVVLAPDDGWDPATLFAHGSKPPGRWTGDPPTRDDLDQDDEEAPSEHGQTPG
ncbi:MAG: cation:proton antiporter [Mycobacteriales bacterium]